MDDDGIIQLGRGKVWEELSIGDRYRTLRRTITETDLVNFISATGMLEAIFIDTTLPGAMGGRAIPGALTCGLIEGLQFQTLLQETGLALLELSMKAINPVFVGDTIFGEITVRTIRKTSKGNRAVVSFDVEIKKVTGETAMTYSATRLVAGQEH